MNSSRALAWPLMAATAIGCRAPAAQPPVPSHTSVASGSGAQTASAVPHGDHNPHHGGIVMMKDDLHYELVVDPGGRAQLYFTDAVREDLPASIASSAAVTLHRPEGSDETIALRIDDAGESWIGSGRAVADRQRTTARVSFTIKGEAYSIELPLVPSPQSPVP